MTINLSKHAGGGNQKYLPGMMTFDGSTGYYNDTYSPSGNKVTVVCKFNRAKYTSALSFEAVIAFMGDGSNSRCSLTTIDSDHPTVSLRDKVYFNSTNTSGTVVCQLISSVDVMDGNDHVLFYAFDGDTGAAVLYVDGVDADDTGHAERVAPTTATLGTTAGSAATIGAFPGGLYNYGGSLGYIGYRDAYLTNPTDFYHPTNGLQELDESGWTEWGSQPLFWNQHGLMSDNKGSVGNMTANGTITPAFFDDPVTFPHLGIPTVGTAVAADIASGKTAWVDGVKITGTAV